MAGDGDDRQIPSQILEWLSGRPDVLRSVLENAHGGVYLQDYRQAQLFWSGELYRIFGVPPDQSLTPETFLASIHPEDFPAVMQTAQRVHDPDATADSYSLAFRIRRPSGELRWLEASAHIERDSHGHPMREFGLTRDVTEQHQLREQLNASQRLQIIGHLAGGVAHDFNNLLTAIMGEVALAREEADPHALHSALEAVEQTADRAAALTRQLLSFARVTPTRVRPLLLADALRPTHRMLRRLLPDSIDLEMNVEEQGWTVRVDPAQLDQVLVNLVVNAGEAIKNRGTVRVSTSQGSQPGLDGVKGATMLLRVEDDGPGIPPDALEKVFDPLYSTKATGTGLGLSTCRDIVEGLGGQLSVENLGGGGACFTVAFPAFPNEVPKPLAEPSRPSSNVGVNQHVLVIEDDASVRHTLCRSLEIVGFRVRSAADRRLGIEAIDKLDRLDLVVSDVQVPGAPLLELAETLGRRRPGTPVLLISGDPTERPPLDEISRLLQSRAAFVGKPFNPAQLVAAICRLLEPSSDST